jgi:hypothetical protein
MKKKRTDTEKVEEEIRFSVDWARNVLIENGIDPDSKDASTLFREKELEYKAIMLESLEGRLALTEKSKKYREGIIAGLKELKQRCEPLGGLEKLERLRPGTMNLGVELFDSLKKQTLMEREAYKILSAAVVLVYAKELRERLHEIDAKLAFKLIHLARAPMDVAIMEDQWRNHPLISAGVKVLTGGAKGRMARPPKLTAEQRDGIKREMTAAKHGMKKSVKAALAQKYKISVREIERIATGK